METTEVPQWTLGDRLRKSLNFADISDEQMAAELGVTTRTLRNYMTDTTRPRRSQVRDWARMTGVPLEWLECAPWDLNPEPADSVLVAA